MFRKLLLIISYSYILSSCAKQENCDVEMGISVARDKLKKQIRSDIYEVKEMEISKDSYKFYLSPPSGGTGFAPLILIDRPTCKAKVIAWH
jgi:hypothetical protein